jgi:hypothetical protein
MRKAAVGLTALCIMAGLARGSVIYSDLPSLLPPNLPSVGFEAYGFSEFGGMIEFAGDEPITIDSATVAMSNWEFESEWETEGTSTGYFIPLTLTLYNVQAGDTAGSLIASETVNAFIPWRPEPDPADCAPGANSAYLASNGGCYNGALSTVTFSFDSLAVPQQVFYGLAYNTTDYGAAPTGVAGPYGSLNFALASTGALVGGDPLPGTAYVNSAVRSGWSPYTGAIEFDGSAVPEMGTLSLMAAGLALVSLRVRRRGRA